MLFVIYKLDLFTRHNWNNLTAYVTKRSPRNVILTYNKAYSLKPLLYIQNKLLNGRYECFVIYEIALNDGRFSVANNILRDEIGRSVKALEMGGFQKLWQRQINQLIMLKASNWSTLKVASSYITTNTLSPFFNIVGITIVLLWVILIAELMSDQAVRDRVRYLVTLVRISVRVRFAKLCRHFKNKKSKGKMRRGK